MREACWNWKYRHGPKKFRHPWQATTRHTSQPDHTEPNDTDATTTTGGHHEMAPERGPMRYDTPITSPEHAQYCKHEAERRYDGKLIRDKLGMLMVQDRDGRLHTDSVLRALSFELVEE